MNASSGGLDIVAKLLNKYFHMELGKAMALPGMCVALSSVFFSDKKLVVLGILGTYLNGIVLDHFIFGLNLKKESLHYLGKRRRDTPVYPAYASQRRDDLSGIRRV